VVTEFHIARTSLDVPQHAGHITRAGDNLTVIDEPTAAEITRMCAQFASAPDIGSLSAMQIVDGAYVVETSTSDEISRWGISASHDPARSKWNGMDFVGGVRIPNDQFSVLRCGDEMSFVGGPMHCVYFGKVTPQSATWPHDDTR
jgi:hypothetical protein